MATGRRSLGEEAAAAPCGSWEYCPYDGFYFPLRTRVVMDGSSVMVEYAAFFCYRGYLSWCSSWWGGETDATGRHETCSGENPEFSGSSSWTIMLRDVEVAATYVDSKGATSYALRVEAADHGFIERGTDRFYDGKYMLWAMFLAATTPGERCHAMAQGQELLSPLPFSSEDRFNGSVAAGFVMLFI